MDRCYRRPAREPPHRLITSDLGRCPPCRPTQWGDAAARAAMGPIMRLGSPADRPRQIAACLRPPIAHMRPTARPPPPPRCSSLFSHELAGAYRGPSPSVRIASSRQESLALCLLPFEINARDPSRHEREAREREKRE